MIKYSKLDPFRKLDPFQGDYSEESFEFFVRDCGYGNWAFRVELKPVKIFDDLEVEMIRLGLFDAYMVGNVHPVRSLVTAFHTDLDPDLGIAFGPIMYCEGVAPNLAHWQDFEGKDIVYREAIRKSWKMLNHILSTLGAEPCAAWIEDNILDRV
jgi:hypothetical protein